MVTIVTQYEPRNRVTVDFRLPSRAHQSFKNDCDINAIMAKYHKTGMLTHLNSKTPLYEDVSNVTDYSDAINTVLKAEQLFSELPATVRKAFGNDPAEFVSAFQDSERFEELEKLGLLEKTKLGEEVQAPHAPTEPADKGANAPASAPSDQSPT